MTRRGLLASVWLAVTLVIAGCGATRTPAPTGDLVVLATQLVQAVPLTGAANAQGALAFVAYLTSDRGRAILDAANFQEP
jgi:hypothetical protein